MEERKENEIIKPTIKTKVHTVLKSTKLLHEHAIHLLIYVHDAYCVPRGV